MEENEQENGIDAGGDESSVRADEPKTCANCGAEIDTEEWHPLVTEVDDDGSFRVFAFCDEDCRDDWAADPGRSRE